MLPSRLRTSKLQLLISHQQYYFTSSAATQRLQGKVALITGGGAGIGRETCLLFAKNGAKIMIADINEKHAKETCEMVNQECATKNKVADWVKMDVSKRDSVAQGVEKAEKVFGKMNVLFNNAGIMLGDDDNAVTTEDDVWDLTFNVNVKGVFYGCKYGIPALQRAGGGSIINTASFVALRGAATPQLAYTSSKGAVLALTRELAVVHAKQNIRLNALCPGPIRTELLMAFLNTDAKKQRRLVHVPMGRFGEAKEMAQGVIFLASDESSYMTGSELIIDGGLCAAYVTPE